MRQFVTVIGLVFLFCSAHAAQGEKAKGPSIFFGATGTEIAAATKGWVKRKDGSQIRGVSNARKRYGAFVELRPGQATLRIDHTGDGLADKQLILKNGPFARKLDRASQVIVEELVFGVMGRLERLGLGGLPAGMVPSSHSSLTLDLGVPFQMNDRGLSFRGFAGTGSQLRNLLLGDGPALGRPGPSLAGFGTASLRGTTSSGGTSGFSFAPKSSFAMEGGSEGDALGKVMDVAYQMYESEGAVMTSFGSTTDDEGTSGYVAEFQDSEGRDTVIAFDADGEPIAASTYESTDPEEEEEEEPKSEEESSGESEEKKEEKKTPPPPPPSTPPPPAPTTTPNPDDPESDGAALATLHPLLQAAVRAMFPLPNLQDPNARTTQPSPGAGGERRSPPPTGAAAIDRKAPYVQPNPTDDSRSGAPVGNGTLPRIDRRTPTINPDPRLP